MRDTIGAKNCRIEIIDNPEYENVLLNIYFTSDAPGEYKQVVIPRSKAKALAHIILGEDSY